MLFGCSRLARSWCRGLVVVAFAAAACGADGPPAGLPAVATSVPSSTADTTTPPRQTTTSVSTTAVPTTSTPSTAPATVSSTTSTTTTATTPASTETTSPPPTARSLEAVPQDRVGQWSETLRIMTLGDSITEGPHYRGMIVRTLDGLGCSFDMVGSRNHFANSVRDADHEGYQSWRTDQLADIAADAAANARPDVVIVHAGTNDMAGGRRPATAAAEVDRIVAQLRTGQPSVDIIVAMIIPYDRDGGEVAAFNALVAEQVPSWEQAGPGRVVLANVYDGFDVDWHTTDGVHPNRAGGDFMGLEFVEALQVLYGGCSS